MKAIALDSAILGGQGCIGSKDLMVANPAPSEGPQGGGMDGTLGTQVASPTVEAALYQPDQYGDGTNGAPSQEPESQYDTIKPIPQG